jgi:hypothetical protein
MAEPEAIEGQIVAAEHTAAVASLNDVMTDKQLKASLKRLEVQRALLRDFVNKQLVEGVDYGKIHFSSSCAYKSTPDKCNNPDHFTKPTLYKPGQEKIFSLMKLTSRLEPDEDTLSMLSEEKGLVAYLCRVYRGGEEVAQGRGAAKIGDRQRDANATIKIAEKRARMDACLSLGFSEFFTQDMEDPEYKEGGKTPAVVARTAAPKKPVEKSEPPKRTRLSTEQVRELFDLVKSQGMRNKEQAVNFINFAIGCPDFTQLPPERFTDYVAAIKARFPG